MSEPEAVEWASACFLASNDVNESVVSDGLGADYYDDTCPSYAPSSVHVISAFLVLTAVIERSLKNAFSAISPKKPVPHLLR